MSFYKIPEYNPFWGKLDYHKLRQLLKLVQTKKTYEIEFRKFKDGYREEALRTCQCIPYEIIKEKDIQSGQVKDVLVKWFIALLALHDEGAPLEPPCRLLVLMAWARMHARVHPLTVSEAFPFCLILVNVLINYYQPNSNYDLEEKCEGEELTKLIVICHKFQNILSPINLLFYIASHTILIPLHGSCNDDFSFDMFLMSNRCNSQKVLAAVIKRLIQDAITPYSTEIVNGDGSYPLHHAVTALANYKVGSDLVEKLLEVGAYPYSVNGLNLIPFKIRKPESRERIGLLERRFITERLISYPPSLKTLTARKILYYQQRISSYKQILDTNLSSSMRNFISRHSATKI